MSLVSRCFFLFSISSELCFLTTFFVYNPFNEHVYSPKGSKKQTICKSRQTNRDRQEITPYTYSYTKDTLNQPVTSRVAQILV